MQARSGYRRRWKPCALAMMLAAVTLGGCADPTSEDKALAHLVWMDPANLMARTVLPEGLGVEQSVDLTLTLTSDNPMLARSERFDLSPMDASDPNAFALSRSDRRRFSDFQQRVVASIGTKSSLNVGLDVPYCMARDMRPRGPRPRAEVWDTSKDQLVMSRPAPRSLSDLVTGLPPCTGPDVARAASR